MKIEAQRCFLYVEFSEFLRRGRASTDTLAHIELQLFEEAIKSRFTLLICLV